MTKHKTKQYLRKERIRKGQKHIHLVTIVGSPFFLAFLLDHLTTVLQSPRSGPWGKAPPPASPASASGCTAPCARGFGSASGRRPCSAGSFTPVPWDRRGTRWTAGWPRRKRDRRGERRRTPRRERPGKASDTAKPFRLGAFWLLLVSLVPKAPAARGSAVSAQPRSLGSVNEKNAEQYAVLPET